MSPTEHRHLSAADGRRLDVQVSGPEGGATVLFHFGTPSAGILYPPMVELGAERGLRHVTYSRPGYGRSDRAAGRSVADCARDVTTVLDELGIDRCHVVGWSGGGPHALACAALLPERTIAVATLAGVAPYDAEDLDFLAGMGEENHEEFGAAIAGPGELESYLRGEAEGLSAATGADVHAAMGELLSEVDRGAATGEFAEYLASLFRGALETDIWGWFDDDLAFTMDWGFELASIERPVAIWQGPEDRMVPFSHGQWLAGHVPGAEPRLLEGEGHLSILLGLYGDVLDGLVAAGR